MPATAHKSLNGKTCRHTVNFFHLEAAQDAFCLTYVFEILEGAAKIKVKSFVVEMRSKKRHPSGLVEL